MPHTLLIFSSFSYPCAIPNIPLSILSLQFPYSFTNAQSPSSASSQSSVYNPQHPLRPGSFPFFGRLPPRGSCAAATRATVAGFGTLEEILVLRRRMNYTSPAPLGLFEPRRGELESGAEISECNSYASQHLDSLRSSKPCHCCPRCRYTAPSERQTPKKREAARQLKLLNSPFGTL